MPNSLTMVASAFTLQNVLQPGTARGQGDPFPIRARLHIGDCRCRFLCVRHDHPARASGHCAHAETVSHWRRIHHHFHVRGVCFVRTHTRTSSLVVSLLKVSMIPLCTGTLKMLDTRNTTNPLRRMTSKILPTLHFEQCVLCVGGHHVSLFCRSMTRVSRVGRHVCCALMGATFLATDC